MSQRNSQCTRERAFQVLSYDAETGDLRWKARPRHEFTSDSSWKVTTARFAGEIAGGVNGKGYRSLVIDGVRYQTHRIIWLMVHGEWPEEVDHINGVKDDNRLVNLRSVSNMEDCHNQKRRRALYPGVYRHSQYDRWWAEINAASVRKFLGSFATYREAVEARRQAERDVGFHPNHGRKVAA